MDQKEPPNYVAWAAATAAGVIITYFVIRQYEIYQATEMIKEIARTSERQGAAIRAQTAQFQQQALLQAEALRAQNEQQRARAEAQQREQVQQVRDKRAVDSIGAPLSRQCGEWTRAVETMQKSDYAQQEKAKFCSQLEAYTRHGTPPSR